MARVTAVAVRIPRCTVSSTIKPRLVAAITEAMIPISPTNIAHKPKVNVTGTKFGIKLTRPSLKLRRARTSIAEIQMNAT